MCVVNALNHKVTKVLVLGKFWETALQLAAQFVILWVVSKCIFIDGACAFLKAQFNLV